MKVTGAELLQFMNSGWPKPEEDFYWDHDVFEDPDPEATYDTDDIGGIYYQGKGDDPTPNGNGWDLATLIKKWRKARDFTVLSISIPKGREDDVRAALAQMGVKF